jgi:hypothetical protein
MDIMPTCSPYPQGTLPITAVAKGGMNPHMRHGIDDDIQLFYALFTTSS